MTNRIRHLCSECASCYRHPPRDGSIYCLQCQYKKFEEVKEEVEIDVAALEAKLENGECDELLSKIKCQKNFIKDLESVLARLEQKKIYEFIYGKHITDDE